MRDRGGAALSGGGGGDEEGAGGENEGGDGLHGAPFGGMCERRWLRRFAGLTLRPHRF